MIKKKLFFIVNVDWFFLSHRKEIALNALNEGYEVHLATQFTNKLNEIQKLGIIVHPISLNRSNINLFDSIALFFNLFLLLFTCKPNIVHLITIKPIIFGGIVAKFLRIPLLIVSITGLGYIFTSKSFNSSISQYVIGKLYGFAISHKRIKIIFQNLDDVILLKKYILIEEDKIFLIQGSGVDLNKFKYTPINKKFPKIILPARMIKDKGILEFISAARIIKKKNCNIVFQLVGGIDEYNPSRLTKNEIECWVKEGIIEWLGHCNDMSKVFSDSYLVVLPSYREGFPKVLMEAAACGRAIVTTDVPGCRDTIVNGKTGILVPIYDSEILANSIYSLIEDFDLCKSMGEEGRKYAIKNFNVIDIVVSHLNIYKS
jgi:glycosyltransferase involved in cell wall biosynthesis